MSNSFIWNTFVNSLKSDNTPVMNNPLVIWRLIDGKPGHENQSLGLVNALSSRTNCQCIDIKVSNNLEGLLSFLTSSWSLGSGLPLPDLIVGAGHATHLHLLAAKRAFGGKTIVLMQPSLPVSLFDTCMIPQHDQYHGLGEYIETRGVLNVIKPEGEHLEDEALIMVGGPSKHCHWDTPRMIAQVYELVNRNPNITYTLTTSRRTPQHFVSAVKRIHFPNLNIVPFEQTGKGWVAQRLSESAYAWVTEDSVSMVYEALTAGVAVGLLNLPVKRENRVSRGVQQLIQQGLVARFDFFDVYKNKLRKATGFVEADRCSQWLLQRLVQQHSRPAPVLETQFDF